MKLNLAIYTVLSLSLWWQQPLEKPYGLWCQNGVMVSDSFDFRKTKSCRQHALLVHLVLRLALVIYVLLWLNGKVQILNDQK